MSLRGRPPREGVGPRQGAKRRSNLMLHGYLRLPRPFSRLAGFGARNDTVIEKC